MLSVKLHGRILFPIAFGAVALIAAGCGDESGGGAVVNTDRCASVTCTPGSTCNPDTGFCSSSSTSNGTTSTSNGTTGATMCPDDCAQPDNLCDGATAITHSGAGACMDDGTCDFSAVQEREACEFYCDGGQCTTGNIGSPCGGLPAGCKPGSYCDPGTNLCAAGCDGDDDCFDEGETCDLDTNACVLGCADDAFEPNEDLSAASPLDAQTGQVFRAEDLGLCPGDADWYTVELAEGQSIQLQANQVSGEGSLTVTLYGPDGTTMLAGGADGDDLSAMDLAAGDYVIEVVPDDDKEVGYNLIIFIQDLVPLCSNDLQEPNDTAGDASDLDLEYNRTRTLGMLTLCQDDTDYYTFTAAQGDEVSLSFDPRPGAGLNVRIVNDDTGTDLYDDVVTTSSQLSFDDLDAGDHLIIVTSVGEVAEEGEDYGLRITLVEGETAGCVDDAFEDNDTNATAAPLGAPGSDALTWCDGDSGDWYSVFAPSGAEVDITLVYEDIAQGNLALIVYRNSTANTVAIGSNGMCNGEDCITTTTLTATGDTTFLISIQATVVNNPDSELNYSLDIDVSGCPPDINEPNNMAQEGVATDLDTTCRTRGSICPGDDDWYRITTNSPDEVFVLSAHFFHSQGDVDLTLYIDGDNNGTIESTERIDRSWNPADCESVTNEGNTGVTEYWLKADAPEAPIEQDAYRVVWGSDCEADEPQIRFCGEP